MKKIYFVFALLFMEQTLNAQTNPELYPQIVTGLTMDKTDYQPGEIAKISGSGFQSSETVTLQVLHADGTPSTGDDHLSWNVNADANGNISTEWHVCTDDCLGSLLRITAHGNTSGLQTSLLFTDASTTIIVINNSYQGWYGDAPVYHNAGNTNYIVGYSGNQYRNYFTFDLSTLNLFCKKIISTTLSVIDGGCSSGNSSVSYSFFDVSTSKNDLVISQSGATASAIWTDLGTGTNYGTFTQSTLFTGTRSFALNQNAMNDIATNAGSWFSIGGALASAPSNEYLFGCSGSFPQQLVITLEVGPTITCPPNITANNDPGVCGAVINYSIPTTTNNCSLSQGSEVLLIWDVMNANTTSLQNALIAAGLNVSLSATSETGYDGTNPSLAAFDVVIHLNGTTYSVGMPIAGQNALVNFVLNQNHTYITEEWSAFEVDDFPTMTAMSDIIVLKRNSGTSGTFTYNTVPAQAGHPILAGLPASFILPNGGSNIGPARTYGSNQPVVLMTSVNGAAVAVRDFPGGGHAVGFQHAGNYNGYSTLSDINVQKLYINAVKYASGSAVTKVQTGGLASGATFPIGTTTNTFVATDAGGNTATCSFTVTVVDNEPPVINCPGNQTVNTDPDLCTYTFQNQKSQTLYASDRSANLYKINTTTGVATLVGNFGSGNTSTEIEYDFNTGKAFSQNRDGLFSSYEFNIITGSYIGPVISNGGSHTGLEYVGSTLYGTVIFSGGGSSPSQLHTLNPLTGVSTNIGSTGVGAISGLAYHILSGVMYGIEGGPAPANLYTINLTTGAATVIGSTGIQAGSLEFGPDGRLYAGSTGSNASKIYTINTSTGAATLIGASGISLTDGITGLTLGGSSWDATAKDNCALTSLTYALTGVTTGTGTTLDGVVFNKGVTTVTWTATDGVANTSICSFTVTVIDNQPPVIPSTFVSKTSLWPPNHKMVDIILDASDNCEIASANVTVTSNEPINDIGDGNTDPDWVDGVITPGTDGKIHIQLRAERSGVQALVTPDIGRIYTVTWVVTDASGNTSSGTNTVTVAHNITAPNTGNSFKIGTTVSLAGTFWDVPGNKHTAKWVIDGTTVNGIVTAEPTGTKVGKVTGSYKPTAAGVYKLRMNVTDQKGITSYATTNGDNEAFLVAYDPKGGYAYGAGKFSSPKGALKSNPNQTGKVAYGFAANYFKNATNPKGETEFDFRIGDLEFTALNFDYLVVNGAKAQFKGLGKTIINGVEQGGIAFIMTVIDGQATGGGGVDKIRMKIYNKNTGAVIYDNQSGASDAADPTMAADDASKTDNIVVVNITGSTTANTSSRSAQMEVTTEVVKFNVIALPNPTTHQFNLRLESNSNESIELRVFDMYGRMVYSAIGASNKQYQFGNRFVSGAYVAEVRQGVNRSTVKLIKQ